MKNHVGTTDITTLGAGLRVIFSPSINWTLFLWCLVPKVKVKLFLCFNWEPRHEGVLGSWGYAPRIPDFGTRWRGVISFTLRPFYPQGKSPWYPLDRRLGGPQSRFGRGGEEKNSQPLPGLEPPIIRPVTQRYNTELSHFYGTIKIFFPCILNIFNSYNVI
jgi:hypothetical protein